MVGRVSPLRAVRSHIKIGAHGLSRRKTNEGGSDAPYQIAQGEENCRCQKYFGMDDRGKGRLNSFI